MGEVTVQAKAYTHGNDNFLLVADDKSGKEGKQRKRLSIPKMNRQNSQSGKGTGSGNNLHDHKLFQGI